jgi:hypothetical protein
MNRILDLILVGVGLPDTGTVAGAVGCGLKGISIEAANNGAPSVPNVIAGVPGAVAIKSSLKCGESRRYQPLIFGTRSS